MKYTKFTEKLQMHSSSEFPTTFFNRNTITLALVYIIINTANIYLFKVDNRNTRKRCEMCPKLTIKTPIIIATTIKHNKTRNNRTR